jgi:hypothetical protein
MIFVTTLSSQRLKSGVLRVTKLQYYRSLIWLRFVLFCLFVLLSGPSTHIGQRVSSLDSGVRERVKIVNNSPQGHFLCEMELFRNRGTAHQSLPSDFSVKLLAKLFFFCGCSPHRDN